MNIVNKFIFVFSEANRLKFSVDRFFFFCKQLSQTSNRKKAILNYCVSLCIFLIARFLFYIFFVINYKLFTNIKDTCNI